MSISGYFRSVVGKFFRRSQTATEMEEELRSHIECRADDLERSGLGRAEAERQARVEFGGQERYKEEIYRSLGGNFIETTIGDVRFSLRVLRKSPAFATVAVITLALAIGANAVVFGVLNALVLRPLNLPKEESLYDIERGANGFVSYLDYVDARDRNHSFDGMAASNITMTALDTGKDPSSLWTFEVSGNYFEVLGIHPHLGRLFNSSDEHGAASAPYAVLSYAYWHTHLQDDPAIVGKTIRLNKNSFTVVGITPPGFHGTLLLMAPDVYVPIVNHDLLSGNDELNARSKHWLFETVGHLKPGVTQAQAAADLNSIGDWLQKTYPKEEPTWKYRLARPGLYGSFLGDPIRGFVAGLMLLAVLILLAACANLGSLFAARAADRSREVALRLALGSGRSRILRQLLTEATLISLVGGTIGLLGSILLLHRLSEWQPFPRFPLHLPVNPDTRVYVVALVLALVSGLLFGLVPVRQVLRANPYEIVKAGPGLMHGRRFTARDVLLVTQIAICAVLVTSSMVAVRGLVRSLHMNFGIQPEGAVLAEADVSMAGYRGEAIAAMQKRMFDAMGTIPGVKAVGMADEPPLSMNGIVTVVYSDKTTDLTSANVLASPWMYRTSPGYFQAAGTALLAGRTFTWHDDKNAPAVAVINREFARTVFGSVDQAVGRYFKLREGTLVQAVGVVEDGKYFMLAEDLKPAMFLPLLQSPWSDTWLVVRSDGDMQQLAIAMRTKLRDLDHALPVYIQPWDREIEAALFPARIATLSLGILGGMGAVLSLTGIFGMAAYSVGKRLRELGIRIALGAKRTEVLQAALGRAVRLLAFGSMAGLLLGILASRVLAVIVYQATPRDPLVLAAVVLAMALLGLLATWVPAQRALKVDPMLLLREE